jgi:hypothetical protein
MLLPLPYLTLIAVVLAVAAAWWWLARVRVTAAPPPVAMLPQRIAFPGGIPLHDPAAAIAALDKPDEIVIPFEHAVLVIAYPLTHPATIAISAPLTIGFTRATLVKMICDEYAHVYDAEEGTAATKTIPVEERGALTNRNRTDGAYGIWGHDLADLVLTAARWTREPDGTVRIELHVES